MAAWRRICPSRWRDAAASSTTLTGRPRGPSSCGAPNVGAGTYPHRHTCRSLLDTATPAHRPHLSGGRGPTRLRGPHSATQPLPTRAQQVTAWFMTASRGTPTTLSPSTPSTGSGSKAFASTRSEPLSESARRPPKPMRQQPHRVGPARTFKPSLAGPRANHALRLARGHFPSRTAATESGTGSGRAPSPTGLRRSPLSVAHSARRPCRD